MLNPEFLPIIESMAAQGKAEREVLPADELMREALSKPLGFDSLRQVVVPGDCVVIAIVDPVPSADRLLLPLVEELGTILASDSEQTPDGKVELLFSAGAKAAADQWSAGQAGTGLPPAVMHDPGDEKQLALLATSADDQPMQVNRRLFDADVVLLVRSAESGRLERNPLGLYPELGGLAGIRHARKRGLAGRCADEKYIERSLGVVFEMTVLSRPGGELVEVAAGDPDEVHSSLRKSVETLWACKPAAKADLVVATIETLSAEPDWEQVRKALLMADRVSVPGTPLAIVTAIKHRPARSVVQLLEEATLNAETDAQAEGASGAAQALGNRPVYLAANLPSAVIERLGFGSLKTGKELQKLLTSARRPLLLRDAHKRMAR